MEFKHKPVLLNEVIDNLKIKPSGIYIDGTLGGAGHSTEILKRLNKDGILIGIDQDEEAIKHAKENLSKISKDNNFKVYHENFENIDKILKINHIDKVEGVLLDIGVSSYQLDNEERGFSYNTDAELDMRMNKRQKLDAKSVINTYTKKELKRIFYEYGEENWSARVANFIVEERKNHQINTTDELVSIIKAAIPKGARRNGPHPAKRIFQAIRIEVNNELEVLKTTIKKAENSLTSGGRLLIITFHSLEDRIVKKMFLDFEDPCTCPKEFPVCICNKKPTSKIINRKPIMAKPDELEDNPRARSAKLRILEKL